MFSVLAAEASASGIDLAPVAQKAVDTLTANVSAILPVAAVGFATVLGIRMAPRVIKWFLRG